MAGGEGSRLRPLTAQRPKPLVPIGTVPIMEHLIRHLARQGFTDILATTFYLGDEIKTFFGDGRDFDVNITYSHEPVPLGTAGSVKNAQEFLKDEPFLIVSGDALTDCDFQKAIKFHQESGAVATLILHRVPNPLEFGVVITDADGNITNFQEKPDWSQVQSDTVNTGMYIINPEVFDLMKPDAAYDWSQDIFPLLLSREQKIMGYVMDGYWCDIGSLNQYREAQEHLLGRQVNLPLPGAHHDSGIFMGHGCQIDESAVIIPPVVLGENVKIKRGARVGPYTTLGDNVLVEEYALLERAIVWEKAYIGSSSSVRAGIVGARATLKKDTVVMEDAVVGDRCVVDMGATIRPRVKLWPDKTIERGSTVTMSMVWGNRWHGSLFRELGVAGISNIEMTPDFAGKLSGAFGSIFPQGAQIVTSRDSSRSSRMLKRSMIASLLSVGCNVLDLRSAPLPIARHFIGRSSAVGAISVRKLPGNHRVSLIEMFDSDGSYLDKNMERKVQNLFFREDYRRADAEDIGVLEFSGRAVDEYETDYFQHIHRVPQGQSPRIVCDYGYSALAGIYPAILGKLGIESVSLNAFNDARRAPRSQVEIQAHLRDLGKIVGTLNSDLGALFLDEGERIAVVDDRGDVLDGYELFACVAKTLLGAQSHSKIAVPIHMPLSLCDWLEQQGAQVVRTKSTARNLIGETSELGAVFGGDERGGFIFSSMHPGFDAAFTLGWLTTWLSEANVKLSDLRRTLPSFPIAYSSAGVQWDAKGAAMRSLLEWASPDQCDLFDGVRVPMEGGSVLVIPDTFEPLFHVYAETGTMGDCQASADEVVRKIQSFIAS